MTAFMSPPTTALMWKSRALAHARCFRNSRVVHVHSSSASALLPSGTDTPYNPMSANDLSLAAPDHVNRMETPRPPGWLSVLPEMEIHFDAVSKERYNREGAMRAEWLSAILEHFRGLGRGLKAIEELRPSGGGVHAGGLQGRGGYGGRDGGRGGNGSRRRATEGVLCKFDSLESRMAAGEAGTS